MDPGWRVEERLGTATQLHAAWPSTDGRPRERAVARCRPIGPAVVLGSTQSGSAVDASAVARSGTAVARRRSGGGAVLVGPGDPVWIDVWLPVDDPLWEADVARAFSWLGAVWASTLRSLGVEGPTVQGMTPGACTRWSKLACFGGVGTGEVSVGDGRKVVGLAQRRTRAGSWFHGACLMHWDPLPLLHVLSLPGSERRSAEAGLSAAAVGVADLDWRGRPPPDGDAVVAAFLTHLP